MGSEKAVGWGLIIVALGIFVLYLLWGLVAVALGAKNLFESTTVNFFGFDLYVPPLYWLLFVPIFALIIILAIGLFWIGHALITTPPVEEIKIEEIEKELEEEEKKAEEEAKKEETEEKKES